MLGKFTPTGSTQRAVDEASPVFKATAIHLLSFKCLPREWTGRCSLCSLEELRRRLSDDVAANPTPFLDLTNLFPIFAQNELLYVAERQPAPLAEGETVTGYTGTLL